VQIRHDHQGGRAGRFMRPPWHAVAVDAQSQTSTPIPEGEPRRRGQQPQPVDAARRHSQFGSNRDAAGTRHLTRIALYPLQLHTHLQQRCGGLLVNRLV